MPQLPNIPQPPVAMPGVAVPRTGSGVAYDALPNAQAAAHAQEAAGLGQARATVAQLGQVGEAQQNAMQALGAATARIAQSQTGLQDKEDWISTAMARQDFYKQADQLFNDNQAGLTTKDSLDQFTQKLAQLHDQTLAGYTGSDAGKVKLMEQLGNGMVDYNNAALRARAHNIDDLTQTTLGMTTNRLATKAYEMPSMLSDWLTMSDAAINDATSAMSPANAAAARQKMQSSIVYSAIDGRLNYGDTQSAVDLLASPQAQLLQPQERTVLDRRVREMQLQNQQMALASAGRWSAGPGGVMSNSLTGQQMLPDPSVQQYQMDLQQAGRANNQVTVQNQAEGQYAKDRASAFTKQLDAYAAQAQTSSADLQRTRQIDQLLSGVPTGNLPANIQFQVSRFLGVDANNVANRQVADKMTGDMVLEIVRKLAPVTEDDRKYAETLTPGSAQTPAGRKKMLYLMERNSEFDQSMQAGAQRADAAVAAGVMSPSQALQKMQQWDQFERNRMAKTFNPPQFAP